MELEFSGEIVYWRGPAPYHFVEIPDAQCGAIESVAREVTYGWGCIPVAGRIGDTDFTTSLFPKDGGYMLPVKVAVRRAEDLDLGDVVNVEITLDA